MITIGNIILTALVCLFSLAVSLVLLFIIVAFIIIGAKKIKEVWKDDGTEQSRR